MIFVGIKMLLAQNPRDILRRLLSLWQTLPVTLPARCHTWQLRLLCVKAIALHILASLTLELRDVNYVNWAAYGTEHDDMSKLYR